MRIKYRYPAYLFPTIYELMLKWIHGKNLSRYKVISTEIGRNKKVLDVGCGTCLLYDFIDKTNKYYGIDLNRNFLDYAIKKRKVNVIYSNVFNFEKYPKVDVIVVCDTLHHVYPKHTFLLKSLLKSGKKIIVCEPVGKTMGIFTFIGDADGINPNRRNSGPVGWKKEFKTKDDVIRLFKSFGAKKIKIIGKDVIGIF